MTDSRIHAFIQASMSQMTREELENALEGIYIVLAHNAPEEGEHEFETGLSLPLWEKKRIEDACAKFTNRIRDLALRGN